MSRNIYFEFFNVLSAETKQHLAKIYSGDKIPIREIFDAIIRRNSCVTQKVRRSSYSLLPEQTSFISNLQSRSTPKIKQLAADRCKCQGVFGAPSSLFCESLFTGMWPFQRVFCHPTWFRMVINSSWVVWKMGSNFLNLFVKYCWNNMKAKWIKQNANWSWHNGSHNSGFKFIYESRHDTPVY